MITIGLITRIIMFAHELAHTTLCGSVLEHVGWVGSGCKWRVCALIASGQPFLPSAVCPDWYFMVLFVFALSPLNLARWSVAMSPSRKIGQAEVNKKCRITVVQLIINLSKNSQFLRSTFFLARATRRYKNFIRNFNLFYFTEYFFRGNLTPTYKNVNLAEI